MFPSPLGDCVFNHYEKFGFGNLSEDVSVPLSGLCFQSKIVTYILWLNSGRFRPLSGIVFSISIRSIKLLSVTIEGTFPSPLGDCVFNLALDEYNDCWIFEFPSPLGDCVFNLVRGGCNYEKESSFRPLSGIVFSIKLKPQRFTHPYRSFRPLSGICVFNRRAVRR